MQDLYSADNFDPAAPRLRRTLAARIKGSILLLCLLALLGYTAYDLSLVVRAITDLSAWAIGWLIR